MKLFLFLFFGIAHAKIQFGSDAFLINHSTECDECRLFIFEFKTKVLENKKYEEEVLNFLHNDVCPNLKIYKSECDTFMDWFIPDIFAELDSYCQDTRAVCTAIELCHPKVMELSDNFKKIFEKSYRRSAKNMLLMNDLVCDECRLAIYEFRRRVLKDPEMQKKFGRFIAQKFCPAVGKYWPHCSDFVTRFVSSLFNEAAKYVRYTNHICSDIGFCPRG